MRRKDRQMSEDFAWAAFDKCVYSIVSVTDTDGSPYALPYAVARKDNHLYYHNFSRGHMYDIMKTNPRVCVTCVPIASVIPRSNDLVYASTVMYGTGHVVEDDEEKILAMRLVCEKVAADNLAGFDKAIPFSLPHMGIVRIDVDEISGKAHLPGVSQDSIDS